MDFITQNLLGAVAGHAAFGRSKGEGGLGRLALAAGALGGAVPDFDFLLKPFADPALPFEWHRHFTHAIWFIPIGGLIAALPFLLFKRGRTQYKTILLAAIVGCATHGLLDNLTSFGTYLLWPFVGYRTAWDAMSIVDPLFTGVLLLGVIVALWRDRPRPTRLAGYLALAYIAIGFLQHHRAADAQRSIARERGHEIEHGRVMPTLGNVIVFRSLYRAEGRIWADAVRVTPFGPVGVRGGVSAAVFDVDGLPSTASPRALDVFRGLEAFADGFVAEVDRERHDTEDLVLGDMRISMDADGFRPLWGVAFDREDGTPAAWNQERRRGDSARRVFQELIDDVIAPEGRFRSLPRGEPTS